MKNREYRYVNGIKTYIDKANPEDLGFFQIPYMNVATEMFLPMINNININSNNEENDEYEEDTLLTIEEILRLEGIRDEERLKAEEVEREIELEIILEMEEEERRRQEEYEEESRIQEEYEEEIKKQEYYGEDY